MGPVVSSSHVFSAAPSSSGEASSHSAPAPAWVPSHGRRSSTSSSNMSPSHGLQLFTNCPSVGPFHGVQSFRNRLLQRGSPTGSQALPEISINAMYHLSESQAGCQSEWQKMKSVWKLKDHPGEPQSQFLEGLLLPSCCTPKLQLERS